MVVVLFAALGGWLSASYMPSLLDYIFNSVEEANMEPAVGNFPDDLNGGNEEENGQTPEIEKEGQAPDVEAEGQPADPGTAEPQDGDDAAGAGDDGSQGSIKPSRDMLNRSAGELIEQSKGYTGSTSPGVLAALALLGAILGGAVGNRLALLWNRLTISWHRMIVGDKVSISIGIFIGIIVSMPFMLVLKDLEGLIGPFITSFLIVCFSMISIYALRSMEEVLPWYKQTVSRRRTGRKILDTNVIIDGRILDVARTGFLEGEIYVPRFVIEELQHIADSADGLRRQRGRRGLEVLRILQSDYDLEVGTEDHRIGKDGDVDGRLVKLAKVLGGDLVSNDYNLNKVASLQDVTVLNINDLALSLRPNVLPGETLNVAINREGNQAGQGIGYLEDGTMVVVEEGKPFVGETVEVAVTQVIQTERGKMIFADNPASHGREGPDLFPDKDGV